MRRRETQLDKELRFHVDELARKYVAAGMSREEAERRARIEFGGIEQMKEGCRQSRMLSFLDTAMQDLRYGLRVLRKSPAFTLVAVATLALGIGANTTVFSFIDSFFLRPLPARDPLRLVNVYSDPNPYAGFAYPEYAYFRDHSTVFEGLAAQYATAPLNVVADGDSREAKGAVVSGNYFTLLGIHPVMGRFFTPDEDAVPDRNPVAVISFDLWQDRFAGDPAIIGKRLLLNGAPFEVIGVASPGFHGAVTSISNDMWIPTMMLRVGWRGCDGFQYDCRRLSLLGRLGEGHRLAEARAEMKLLAAQLAAANPATNHGRGTRTEQAVGLPPGLRKDFGDQTTLLAAVAGSLLLIACANLAGLLLARGAARGKEIALRLSIGASRARLVRQLLTESLLLAVVGGMSGLALSVWANRQLLGFYSTDAEGYHRYYDVSLDPHVLAYSGALTIVTALLFGLLPAFRASRQDLTPALKQGSPGDTGRSLLRSWLVGGQVALSLALLVGAGLLVRSAANVVGAANFDPSHVVLLRLRPGLRQYSPGRAQAFHREVLRRLQALPGVESVSFARGIGFVWKSCCEFRITQPGREAAPLADAPRVAGHMIAPRYFETLRIPFLDGRDFDQRDRTGSPLVAIVNETLARSRWPAASAIGQTLILDGAPYQVVGEVKDARLRRTLEAPLPLVYVPYWQDDQQTDSRMCIRVTGDPAAMLPVIRREIASTDSNVPINEDMPMKAQVEGDYMPVRMSGAVLSCAGILALFLSAVGLYGVLAFSVSRRTREIGIRMALGARPMGVLGLILKQGMTLALAGTVAGLVMALSLTRLLAAWLYGVRPSDPATFLGGAALLFAVALLACYLPARRATKVDPMVALRYE